MLEWKNIIPLMYSLDYLIGNAINHTVHTLSYKHVICMCASFYEVGVYFLIAGSTMLLCCL